MNKRRRFKAKKARAWYKFMVRSKLALFFDMKRLKYSYKAHMHPWIWDVKKS